MVFQCIRSAERYSLHVCTCGVPLLPSTPLNHCHLSVDLAGETINPSGSLALPRDGRTITLWNYDVAAFNAGVNLYGSHPFVLQVYEGRLAGIHA